MSGIIKQLKNNGNWVDSFDLEGMGEKYSSFVSFLMANSNGWDDWYNQIK